VVDRKTEVLVRLIQASGPVSENSARVLVVGCGDGEEARDIAQLLGCPVTAIDIKDGFRAARGNVDFRIMDARKMDFPDGSFDLVYSFHAIEHINDPGRAIAEMKRVLRTQGAFCVGVPNRRRLVGYITGRGATLSEKIRWNLADWRRKLQGTFRNELGAHAGFTIDELMGLCSAIGPCRRVTRDYYASLYINGRAAIDVAGQLGLWPWLFPCEYVVGHKNGTPEPAA
jgi:SAM-dependent methyltransferase